MSTGLSIILLNYHGLADTVACLESLRAAELGTARVLVVENGSGAEDVAGLRRWNEGSNFFEEILEIDDHNVFGARPRVHSLLISKENHGFAGGNNLATRIARARGDEEVLLLNNDTVVEPDFLSALLAGRDRHPEAVLIPQIRLHARPATLWNCGGVLYWPGRKKYNYENAPVATLPVASDLPVTFVTGCALLYRPAKTGLLTERFFFGEEDMEFSWRLRAKGIKAFCIPASVIYHKVGTSLQSNYRKSEIFTLKRLVNLRVNVGGTEAVAGYLYYLLNLLRLLTLRYGQSPLVALRSVYRVAQNSLRMDAVGEDLCVGYVRGAYLTEE